MKPALSALLAFLTAESVASACTNSTGWFNVQVLSSPEGYKKGQWGTNAVGSIMTFNASRSQAQAYRIYPGRHLGAPFQNDEGQTLIGLASANTPPVAQKVKYKGTPRDTLFFDKDADPYPVANCSIAANTCHLKCRVVVDRYLYNSFYINHNSNEINNLAFGSTRGNNTLYVGPVQLKASPAS